MSADDNEAGCYRINLKIPNNLKDDQLNGSNGKKAFVKHLEAIKHQNWNFSAEEELELGKNLLSTEVVSKRIGVRFEYRENLDFSLLDAIATARPNFPAGINMQKLQSPLQEFFAVSFFF